MNYNGPNKGNMDYVSCNICGGLGNQLFQIANTICYAAKYNKKTIFKNTDHLPNQHGFERRTQWSTLFNNKLNVVGENVYNTIKFNIYHENIQNVYTEIPEINGNVLYQGYFQSSKYFSDINTKMKMQELIYSNKDYMNNAYNLYCDITQFFDDEVDDNYVSIHVRRGDYLYIQNYHNVLDMNYYSNAYDIVSKNGKKHIILFSDDIEWCKNNFNLKEQKIFFVDINNLCIEIILMSFIKHNIIANSTFSWWGSYISNHLNKIVVAPKQWFGRDGPREWSDIYIKDWYVI